ncbi:PaaI family thioesterase [Alcaligenaceae bacterium]|nr:PaaI family thioesterase [Alcaligenaceae bacterium]
MNDTEQIPGEPLADSSSQGWREHHPRGLMGTIGPLLSRQEEQGRAFAFQIDERHLNLVGVVHGGTVTALVDQAISTVAWEHNGRSPCLTVQLNMTFLRATSPGETLVARGRVTHQTGSMLFLEGEVRAGDALVATAQAIMKRVSPERLPKD